LKTEAPKSAQWSANMKQEQIEKSYDRSQALTGLF